VGEALELADTWRVRAKIPAPLIVIAGESDVGKTTLLAAIHESFLNEEFSRIRFAGSLTLTGFERRCHLARLNSGNREPDTPRTLRTDTPNVLHLSIDSIEESQCSTLLLTDLAGEAFRDVSSGDLGSHTDWLHTSDRLVLMVDGELLASQETRQSALNRSILLARQLLELQLVSRHIPFDIVVSKWDLIVANQADDWVKTYVIPALERIVEGRVFRLGLHYVAARSTLPNLRGHGLEGLLQTWMNTDVRGFETNQATRREPSATRMFNIFRPAAHNED
jgi:hypothetical protein